MSTRFFLDLARQGLRMPIGVDLVLHEQPDPEAILLDAGRLGGIVESAARRYQTPLAFPLMDLRLEKADLLSSLGIPERDADRFQFHQPPSAEQVDQVRASRQAPFSPRIAANQGAIRYIATQTDLYPVAMVIGPFSLMTKLLVDPIAPVAMAGAGATGDDEHEVRAVECCLAMALAAVERSAEAQIQAGARAIIVCEPAANIVYLSPRQMCGANDIFERFVLQPNRQLRDLLRENGVDLIFHDCGELRTDMVRRFALELHPAILSLGSSRKLWEDAAVLPRNIVLFGNLPTKTFYSDAAMPLTEVIRRTVELRQNMSRCGHPHILGSECDVLHVEEAGTTIRQKVQAMLSVS